MQAERPRLEEEPHRLGVAVVGQDHLTVETVERHQARRRLRHDVQRHALWRHVQRLERGDPPALGGVEADPHDQAGHVAGRDTRRKVGGQVANRARRGVT
ncbi:hypothetical protein [Actinoallomurus oryzae]|uniref:hypothetical protein n=1 Tax=Actinoallomurus oryzae TaxID=502180 RepID=UPI0031EB8FDB